MRATKDASGRFTIDEEPFILEGEAAAKFRVEVAQSNSTPMSDEQKRDLENCVRLYTEAWTKRAL